MNDELEYNDRFCYFIDFLGFKSHIKELDDNGKSNIDKVKSIYESIKVFKDLEKNLNEINENCKVSQFSDSIAISFPCDVSDDFPFMILVLILHAQLELACNGFLIRGGVSCGKLFHSKDIIFGQALVDAYKLESDKNEAVYPRIILDKKVVEKFFKNCESINSSMEKSEVEQLIKKDNDDRWYLDYFESAMNELDTYSNDFLEVIEKSYKYIKMVEKNSLSKLQDENLDNEIRKKLEWVQEKLNNFKNDLAKLEQKIAPQ